MSTFTINLHEAVYSLSNALDLVGVTHIHHGKRVAYIAAECAKRLGWQGQIYFRRQSCTIAVYQKRRCIHGLHNLNRNRIPNIVLSVQSYWHRVLYWRIYLMRCYSVIRIGQH